jgi:hypothetical protein
LRTVEVTVTGGMYANFICIFGELPPSAFRIPQWRNSFGLASRTR